MSIFFLIKTGVRHGCILLTLLFLLVIDFLMSKSVDLVNNGIRWKKESKLVDFDFADDIALILFRMDFFGAAHGCGEGQKGPPS